MDLNKLYKACEKFEKLAQQKIVLDPKKKNIDFWSKFLYNAIISYSTFLRSPQVAKSIFDANAQYHQTLATGQDVQLKQTEQLLTSFQEAETKLVAAGVNAVDALKKKGMTNLNPNILNILKVNLETLRDAIDFSKYQHFYLPRPGEPKDIIELDNYTAENNPGY